MQILEKYVLKGYLVSFLFCVTLLMILGMLGDILSFIDDIFKNNIPLPSILMFYFYFAPYAFVNMVPFASLLAAVYVFNDLSKNHEVAAVITSGISIWRVMRPIIFVTFIFCLVTFIVNDKIVPAAIEKAGEIRTEKLESGKNKERIIRNLAVYGKNEDIIFAKTFDPKAMVMGDLIIHQQNEKHITTKKINVNCARWRDDSYWLGEDVMIFNLGTDGEFYWEPEVYKNKKLPLRETPKELENVRSDPKMMNYNQLRKYISIIADVSPGAVKRLSVELHYKISFALTALVTVIIGVPFSISTGRVNTLVGMAKGIAIALLYIPCAAVVLSIGKGGGLPPVVAAWGCSAVFIAVGAWFITHKS